MTTTACQEHVHETITAKTEITLTDQQIRSLTTKRIFFGHQSVGDNIVDGIRDLAVEDPRLHLNLVSSSDPQSVPGFAFIETHIGSNRNPQSKNEAFAAILDKGFGSQRGIAFYKYCYIDFSATSDATQVFENYRQQMAALKSKYPSIVFVHTTVPLTADEAATTMKGSIRTLLRRLLGSDPNIARNRFNQLLLTTYGGKEPVFDLSAVESTHPNGSRSYYGRGFQKIYTLAPELTTDGGHLNEAGRRAAAKELLQVLGNL